MKRAKDFEQVIFDEDDALIEYVNLAEENALCERNAFGFTAPAHRRHLYEFDDDEVVCFFEYGVEWDDDGGCWEHEPYLDEPLMLWSV